MDAPGWAVADFVDKSNSLKPDEAAALSIQNDISGTYKDGLELLVRRDLTPKLREALVRRYQLEVAFQDEMTDGIRHKHTLHGKSGAGYEHINLSDAELKYPTHTAIFSSAELFLWAATQQSSLEIVSTFSYNLMLRHCFNTKRMLQLVEIMKENDIKLDSITINTVLTRMLVEGNALHAKDLLAEYANHDPPIIAEAAKTFKMHDVAHFDADDSYLEDHRYEHEYEPSPGKNWQPPVHKMRAGMIDQWASQRGLAGREAVFELLRELERRTRELGILQRGREAPVAWDQPAPLTPGSLQYNTFVHVQTYNAALRCCYSVDDMMEMVLEPMALHGVAP
eukprot:gene16849-24227_t